MAAAVRERVVGSYSVDKIAYRCERLFEEVLERR
jgi:hypothetical protein